MREVSEVFEKGFAIGLRPHESVRSTAEVLMRCYNLVPFELGLEARQDVVHSLEGLKEDYPFPALYILRKINLLFTSDAVYSVANDWDMTLITKADWGSLPQIADFYDFVVIAAANCRVLLLNGAVQSVSNDASFDTCCNFRGQLIVGNATLPKGPEKVGSAVVDNRVSVGGENIVAWTKIGSYEWEYTLGNEVGWAPMPWPGQVLGMLPMEKTVIVYGDGGIARLAPSVEPVTTFGVSEFGQVGVLNRNCFAGDDQTQVFIGVNRELYEITPERALSSEGRLPKRLGYKEWIEQLEDPIISFDPVHRHWWIGDKSKCFIYSGTGLGEASITPSSLGMWGTQLAGYYFSHGTDEALVETGNLCLNSRGIKTLMCVEADLQAVGQQVYGSALYGYSTKETLQEGQEKRLDPRGAFFPVAAGTELRVRLRAPDFHNFFLSKLWLRFKNTDKHFSRGVINAGRPAE